MCTGPAHCHLGCSDHDCELVREGGGGGGGGGVNCLGVYWNSCDQPIATLDAQTMIVSWLEGGAGAGGGGGGELSWCVLEFL